MFFLLDTCPIASAEATSVKLRAAACHTFSKVSILVCFLSSIFSE